MTADMTKLEQKWRTFSLLMYKNFLVRKRHWKNALFVQILLPVLLFVMVQAIRDSAAKPPTPVTNDTIYDLRSMDDLVQISKHLQLYYVPNDNFTKDIMTSVRKCLDFPDTGIIGFDTETDALNKYSLEQNSQDPNNVLMIVFKSNSKSKKFQYSLRTQRAMPHDLFITPGINDKLSLMMFELENPFIQLQHCLNMKFIQNVSGEKYVDTNVFIQQMPSPPYIQMDPGDIVLRIFVSSIATVAFFIPLYSEANFAASEKFIGVNVLMSMNGVSTSKNLFSWLLSGLLFSILYISPVVILFKTSFSSKVNPFLYYSNGFLFWLILLVHVAHLLAFAMHIAAYFKKPVFISSGILCAYICSTLIIKYTAHSPHSRFYRHTPLLGIIFPNILLQRAIEEVNNYEGKLRGIHWSNMFLVGDQTYNVTGSVGMIFIFSIIGAILHFYMTVYVYAVKPGKYGVRKHPLYFLESLRRNKINSDTHVTRIEYNNGGSEPFEPVPESCTPGIQIRNLKKSYFTSIFNRNVSVEALKGISVDFYKSHITVLLGHNGAGKTTMMSILTGMISPTEGTVLINGNNVNKDLDKIMNDMGLCPQDDMFFPDLSVFEQLLFFGMLKRNNKSKAEIKHDVDNLLKKLNLNEKRNCLPSELSGGQKRRVCLGMALIGDAKILILDEPTSGMDPESRRETWDIILGMREQKTILISTHNMEEADILGDRVAIIHSGSLRCYGTSMFLKKLYGQGNIEVTLSTDINCDPEKVRSALSPRAEMINVDNGRLVLSVPYSESLPDALDGLESRKKSLGITGMSVSLITLEQVFLKVTKDADDTVDTNVELINAHSKVTGNALRMQRIAALFAKKFSYTRKNLGILLLIFLLPIIGVVLMMNFNLPAMTEDVVPIDLSLYRSPQAYYATTNLKYAQNYVATVKRQQGVAHPVGLKENLNEALLNLAKKDNTTYLNNVIVAAEFNETDKDLAANAMFSNTAIYSLPISLNIIYNTILKSFANDEYEISMSTQALPSVHMALSQEEETFTAYSRVFIFILFIFPMTALFVIHPLRENVTGIKHLQLMTGTSQGTYWLVMFLFDFLVYLLSTFVAIAIISIMDSAKDLRLYQGPEIMIILLLMILFAYNVLPLMYIMSFWKKQTNTVSIMIQVPIGLTIVDLILRFLIILIHNQSLMKGLRNFQKSLFYLMPHLSFFNGNVAFSLIAAQNARCRNLPKYLANIACQIQDPCCELECSNGTCNKYFPYFRKFQDDPSLEECVTALVCTSFLYFGILFAMEMKLVPKLILRMKKFSMKSVIENSDEQVKMEKHEVAVELEKIRSRNRANFSRKMQEDMVDGNFLSTGRGDSNNLFLVYELSKRYKRLFAVQEVSFKIRQRECFGLLGINGAGKSTTFRMLTGEELPNSGSLYLKERNIDEQRSEYLSQMGYCPQNSAIIETLNSKEHLRLFALLRGVPRESVEAEVNKWIDKLNLHACAMKPSGTYSGGNKRRLNIAIAMIANPSLVLLDEPTTGVDPAARRSLWEVIASCQASGQSIILTSHSMEECEALCNRLVIMVKGELVCIGPSQQLKQKFGAGFDIQVKLKPNRTDEAITDLKNEIESRLPCEISDENAGLLTYHITNDRLTWKAMYSAMNVIKENHSCVEDYTIISATLEQLFLQFARAAKVSNAITENGPTMV